MWRVAARARRQGVQLTDRRAPSLFSSPIARYHPGMNNHRPALLIFLAAIALLATLTGCASTQTDAVQQLKAHPPGRYHIAYSFDPPADWEVSSYPGVILPLAFGPTTNGFRVNINLSVEVTNANLETYFDAFCKSFETNFPNSEHIGTDRFVASSGLAGMRLVMYNQFSGIAMRQSAYIFPGLPGQYAIITCTAPELGGEKYDETFDAVARTFRVH
jgi:hypothetical protein